MLDENLPNFFLKANTDGVKHHQAYYFSQHGSDPAPSYDLHHLDPASPDAKNTYAVALFDAHNLDVLFGEVLLRPGWTHPTLNQEEIRKNGGVAPPPQPILPTSFTVQLYEPDQQVEVVQKTSNWSNTNWYEFSLPQQTFRAPSASALDRARNDPAADATIPKLNFVWRRDSKLSKDMTCFLTGKSTDPDSKKKKNKEADIAVALFSGLKDLTVYESNLYRVEIEDYKGLELVLLLSAAVIKDVFFGRIQDAFHIDDYGRKNSSGGKIGRKNSPPLTPTGGYIAPATGPLIIQSPQQLQPSHVLPAQRPIQHHHQRPVAPSSRNDHRRQSLPPLQTTVPQKQQASVDDPRARWEIEQEAAHLRAQVDNERRAQLEQQRQQQKASEAEAKRLRKQQEAEEKEKRRKQAEVDKETERLRRKYGTQGQVIPPPAQPQRPHQRPQQPQAVPFRPHSQQQQHRPQPQQHRTSNLFSVPQGRVAQAPPPRPIQQGGWHAPARPPQQNAYFGGGGLLRPDLGQTLKQPKRSFFGLRTSGENVNSKVAKKKSSIF
ncbi:hypothetical protein EJ05DRAFT_488466 [Pseudovirgaria hyperparasitica]|uniref:Uncharacterized protein n=1 Tax=Pseudovirgaria hyperparasitica TaxID=470096 RepID=A0A6A6VYN7_9PEZI|nr:uncharacterized protein EJ05DRAFT_488466 [Pseudovirgaria hyperparasitica]KAF2755752.1 hypothetical protein EJ05DRAFT_488466 [Pseudovirgaria hyperparasitica]